MNPILKKLQFKVQAPVLVRVALAEDWSAMRFKGIVT